MATLFRNTGSVPYWLRSALSDNKDLSSIAKYEMTNGDTTSPFYGGNKPFYDDVKEGDSKINNFKSVSSKGLSISL